MNELLYDPIKCCSQNWVNNDFQHWHISRERKLYFESVLPHDAFLLYETYQIAIKYDHGKSVRVTSSEIPFTTRVLTQRIIQIEAITFIL